jgi:hypothetical protein
VQDGLCQARLEYRTDGTPVEFSAHYQIRLQRDFLLVASRG